jgi:hypothetical protein
MRYKIVAPIMLLFHYGTAAHAEGFLEIVGGSVWILRPLTTAGCYAREKTCATVSEVLVWLTQGSLAEDW